MIFWIGLRVQGAGGIEAGDRFGEENYLADGLTNKTGDIIAGYAILQFKSGGQDEKD